MAKNKLNKNWLHEHINDPYVKMAQKEGYRARAVYKLKEIDESEKLIKPGQVIVDLGCAPGSWAQYARNKLSGKEGGGIHGTIIGLDLLPMEPIANVQFIQGDFQEELVLNQLEEVQEGRKVDLVLSDIAPNLSGISVTDAARVEHIIELAIEFAQMHLKPSGALLVKCFNDQGIPSWWNGFGKSSGPFHRRSPKPVATNRLKFFLLGKGLKNPL